MVNFVDKFPNAPLIDQDAVNVVAKTIFELAPNNNVTTA